MRVFFFIYFSCRAKEVVTYKIEESESSSPDLDLNPDHTHFILVDDDNIHLKLLKFRVALEKRLQNSAIGRKLLRKSMPTTTSINTTVTNAAAQIAEPTGFVLSTQLPAVNECDEKSTSSPPPGEVFGGATGGGQSGGEAPTVGEQNQERVPTVSLLIGGGVGSISLVLAKINQSTPVLVFKGTGHAPDLISGAYEDFADR